MGNDEDKKNQVDFRGQDLSGTEWTNKLFQQAYLQQSILIGAIFTDINFDASLFHAAQCRDTKFTNCNVDNISARIADFESSEFVNCSFIGAHFINAYFFNASFTNCTFQDSIFEDCDLRRTRIINCDFGNSRIIDCD